MSQLSEKHYPRCLPLAGFGRIDAETIQRLPANAGPTDMQGKACCWDCSAADTLLKLVWSCRCKARQARRRHYQLRDGKGRNNWFGINSPDDGDEA